MFKIIKLKPIIVCLTYLIASLLMSVGIAKLVSINSIPKSNYKIVLDGGQGGLDVK